MTDAAEHGITADPHAAPAPAQPHFSPAEWQALRQEDVKAAKAIVVLMQGIFVIGLLMYTVVAWSVL